MATEEAQASFNKVIDSWNLPDAASLTANWRTSNRFSAAIPLNAKSPTVEGWAFLLAAEFWLPDLDSNQGPAD
jgi:hypothetical protein